MNEDRKKRGLANGKFFTAVAICALFLGSGNVMAAQTASNDSQGVQEQMQSISVTVTVVDTKGEPIIGANVIEKGTTNGGITDLDGVSKLNVKPGAILQVSFVGYTTQEVKATSVMKVVLKDDTELLDEVVVVGYGAQKKVNLTGAVANVDVQEAIASRPVTDIAKALQGITPGLSITTNVGGIGVDSNIKLRGATGSLSATEGTSPLILVDNVEVPSLSLVNPDDIASISVLKDASAAIYGARAANGVILVTTKRGTEGKVKINYSGNVSFSQPTRIPEMLDSYQYATYVNEYDAGHGEAATYSAEALGMIQSGEDQIRYPNTDWWSEVAKDWATKTQHSLAISGGNDKISFYTSAQYMYQDAIYKKGVQDYNQYQFTTNLDAKITKAIKFSMDILGRQEVRNRGVYSTEDLFGYFLTTNPMAAPYYPNGLLRVGYDGVTNNAAVKVTDIPGTNKTTYSTLNLKPRLRVDLDVITKGLYVEGYAALDFHFNDGKQINNPYDVYQYDAATDSYINRRDATGSISVNQWFNKDKTITLNARLGYSHDFKGGHHVDAFIAYEQSKYDYTGISAYRTNYLSTTIPEIFAGSDVAKDKDNSGSSNVTARQNYFGRINYAYKDKYLTEFTMRYDGSMNFAPGHRWGVFPAFSLGWVMSEEEFFQPLKNVVSFFKVKGSWGMMGNDNVTAYQYMSQYKFIDLNNTSSMCFGDEVVKAIYESRTANPLITWEKAKTWNLGFSSQFLDGKFGLDFDYFQSRRNDILITRNASIPTYSGLVLPAENLGKVKNHGLELIATYRDHSGDFSWGITGNFTYANNKVVYEDEAASTPEWQRRTGHPIDGMVLYKALGIYQTQEQVDNTPHIAGAKPGDLIYQDTNGDGNITWDDAIRLDKSATPKIIFGLTLNGAWKGWDLNVFFQGQADAEQLVQPTMNMATDFYEGRWIETNTAEQNAAAKWPRAFIK